LFTELVLVSEVFHQNFDLKISATFAFICSNLPSCSGFNLEVYSATFAALLAHLRACQASGTAPTKARALSYHSFDVLNSSGITQAVFNMLIIRSSSLKPSLNP
jgi:hypothetical protein